MKQDGFGGCEVTDEDLRDGYAAMSLHDWSSMERAELTWNSADALRADAARLIAMAEKLDALGKAAAAHQELPTKALIFARNRFFSESVKNRRNSTMSGPSDNLRERLLRVMDEYDDALCARKHGDVAAGKAVEALRAILGLGDFTRRKGMQVQTDGDLVPWTDPR